MSKLTDKLDAILIDDWRNAKRYASMWLMGINGVVVAVWATYPDILRELLPAPYIKVLLAFLVISSMLARLWKQRQPENPNELDQPARPPLVFDRDGFLGKSAEPAAGPGTDADAAAIANSGP